MKAISSIAFALVVLSTNDTILAQSFTKITSGSIVTDIACSQSCSWGDFNNDGYPDLFVANYGENNFLYMNNGDGKFKKITDGDPVKDVSISAGSCWGDYDNDGDLDLYVTNSLGQNNFLYRNSGYPDYNLVKINSRDIVNDGGNSYSCGWGDYDNDGNLDLFVANWFLESYPDPNFLYHNSGPPDYELIKINNNVVVKTVGSSMGCNWINYDNDEDLDLYVATSTKNPLFPSSLDWEVNFLFQNDGPSAFIFSRISSGEIVTDRTISRGGSWGDYDNDGDLDLFLCNDYHTGVDFLYQNNGSPDYKFTKIMIDSLNRDSAGSSWVDYDNDGDLDLFVTNWYGYQDVPLSYRNNRLYRNNGPPNYTFTKETNEIIVKDDGNSLGCGWADFDRDVKVQLELEKKVLKLRWKLNP